MSVLVCGGAGYIGSHNVHELVGRGESVVVMDNLQTGHRQAVPEKAIFVQGDIRDANALDAVFREHKVESVLHFAANSLVGESMTLPLKYFDNNVHGMQVLLEAMVRHNVRHIVFSSSAAVYGESETALITEETPTNPTNPYGESKLIMERMMRWVRHAHGVNFVSLRYFNVAGAMEDGTLGEDHTPETHLLPIMLQVPLGKRDCLTIYGQDYPTPDGTCIRDYIHVLDLAAAHLLALAHLRAGGEGGIFNLGNGQGFSVKEMLNAARKVTGHPIPVVMGDRRPGDPPQLVAAAHKARNVLGWSPRFTRVEEIIKNAWSWHFKHPDGFV